METDEGLQAFPKINENNCISCCKCQKTCPSLNRLDVGSFSQSYYASWSKNKEERKQGTSGGVGTALARYAIQQGWVVIGAAFDEQWNLSHSISSLLEDLQKFKGSKYLQSNLNGVLKQTREVILSDRTVLFIGTPCQVEAVKKMIPSTSQDKLITCGIICHGVNSPIVWKDFVKDLEHTHDSKLIEYNFRSKSKGWGKDRRGNVKLNVSYKFANGKEYQRPAWKNQFHFWFGQHVMLRECCFHCVYRQEQRNSDITIGDFWDVERILPELTNTKDGVSVIITSTEKGAKIINECDILELLEVDADKTKNVLKGYLDNRNEDVKIREIERMKSFELEYKKKGYSYMKKSYPALTLFRRLIASIRFHLGIK